MTGSTAANETPGNAARIATALAWTGLALAAACGIAELLAGFGYRWGWWHFRTGIQIMRWAATTDLAAIALALIGAVLAQRCALRRSLAAGASGTVLALLVAGPPLYHWRVVEQVPRIHDITTDTVNPPAFVRVLATRKGAENPVAYNPAVAAQQKSAYPDIVPLRLENPPAEAFQRAERAARSMNWEVVSADAAGRLVEATDTTLLFGFKDDIVIRISPDGNGSRVDARSLSRVGRSDFGVNANRIRAFMKKLQAS